MEHETEEHAHAPEARPTSIKPDDTIYVGKKDIMSYVLAVVTQFNRGLSAVKVKARGRAIGRAVDVSQIVKNRFIPSLRLTNFDAATEDLQSEDGSMSKVSSLTITMEK
ncbi:TPA: DNA-binding protein Alba [Candidatus Micrarchaeota archaeon]|nr:DNA-binding protein Alba [Candidatus Micrarchaeota archaeon]